MIFITNADVHVYMGHHTIRGSFESYKLQKGIGVKILMPDIQWILTVTFSVFRVVLYI